MRHILVDDDTADEGSVAESATDLAENLDEIEWNIAALEVRNCENGVNGYLCEVSLVLGYACGKELA